MMNMTTRMVFTMVGLLYSTNLYLDGDSSMTRIRNKDGTYSNSPDRRMSGMSRNNARYDKNGKLIMDSRNMGSRRERSIDAIDGNNLYIKILAMIKYFYR